MGNLTNGLIKLNVPEKKVKQSGGGWSFDVDLVNYWAGQSQLFTPEEMDSIISLGESMNPYKGTVGNLEISKVRDSHVYFFFPSEETGWIFQRIGACMINLNNQFFGFDLNGLNEGIQFTKYSAPDGHYDTHVDRAYNTAPRKLSLSVQLSNPDSYSGGDLEISVGNSIDKVSRERGAAIVFPSFMPHRVTPISEGTRYSLVAWASGKPFK